MIALYFVVLMLKNPAVTAALDVGTVDATVLTGELFDDFVANERVTMVEFYAPWCGWCKKVAPIFEEAGEQLASTAKLGEVDCTQHKKVCQKFGVRGYPTLKIFRGSVDDHDAYTGAREVDVFVQTVRDALADNAGEAEGEGADKDEL